MAFDGSSTPQVVQDLIATKALIDKPEKWARYYLAKIGDHGVDVSNSHATSFCVWGAALRATGTHIAQFSNDKSTRSNIVMAALAEALGKGSDRSDVVAFNNHRANHRDMMKLIDKAIAHALQKETV